MSLSAIIGALGGITAVVGGIVWFIKYVAWKAQVTPAEGDAQIDHQIGQDKQNAEQGGRPV